MKYYAKIKKQKNGEYLVKFPDLDGCFTEGDTLKEAKEMASEAMNLWLSSQCRLDDRFPIPRPKIRKGADYYPIAVEGNLVSPVLIKIMRGEMGIPREKQARQLSMTPRSYSKLEVPPGKSGILDARNRPRRNGDSSSRTSPKKTGTGSR